MMKVSLVVLCIGMLVISSAASWAAVTYSWEMQTSFADYSVPISDTDVIQGLVGDVDLGGFHPSLPNDPAKFTDGLLGADIDCVLADYGVPTLRVAYTFAPTVISEIRSFVGNPGRDGRVFQDIDVEVSIDGVWSEILHEATTGPFYTNNSGNEASLIRVYDDSGLGILDGTAIDGIRLTYWAVDNTGNWFLSRYDEGCVAASILKEIDVIAVPEPASILALVAGFCGFVIRRRK